MTGRAEFRPGGPYLGMSYTRFLLAARLQRFIVAESADLECRHERMPFDPSPVCGCFPVEGAVVTELKKRTPRRKKAA